MKQTIITILLTLVAIVGQGQIMSGKPLTYMLYIDWQPSIEVFRVGVFSLKWYSLLWMLGLMIAYMIVKHLYKQQGVPEEKFYPQFFYCFIGVLAGARLGHCLFYQPDYFLISGKGIIEMFLPIHIQDNDS